MSCWFGNMVPYLKMGSQLFFLDDNTSSSKYIIATAMSDTDTILNIGLYITAYVVANNVTIGHSYGDYESMKFEGNIYCFN